MVASETKPKSGYWYKIYIYECPACGRTEEIRERQYDKPKPEDVNDRYNWRYIAFCNCLM